MDAGFVILGLVVGLLVGATGVGAGSLITPALVLSGIPPAVAVGTDLAYAAISKSAGAAVHRVQRSLDLRIAGLLAAGSVPAAGATVAALAATGVHTKSSVIAAALAVALVLTALALLAGRARIAAIAARYESRIARHRVALTVAAGVLLGALVTVSSIGAGALGAVLLVALYPTMPAVRVAGTDIAHAVPLTLVGGFGHLWLGTVDFGIVGNLLVGALPGIVVGSILAGRLPDGIVRRLLACVLLYAGVRLGIATVV